MGSMVRTANNISYQQQQQQYQQQQYNRSEIFNDWHV